MEGYFFDDGMLKPKSYFVGNLVIEHYTGTACDDWDITGIGFCEIDHDTLCQYTGLTDKNGKKIWENDIVDTFEESSKEFLRNVVKLEDGCFKVFKKHYLSMYMDSYEKTDLKVVGNIFDNPDLLEVE